MIFIFHKQETDYSCGPAAVRMVLESFGIKKTEKELIKLLKSKPKCGTWFKNFAVVSKKLNIYYKIHKDSNISDLKKYLKDGFKVIVCYFILDENIDHYSIIKKIDSKNIYFWDPWFGPNHKYSIGHFRIIWRSRKRHDQADRWFIAMKKI